MIALYQLECFTYFFFLRIQNLKVVNSGAVIIGTYDNVEN